MSGLGVKILHSLLLPFSEQQWQYVCRIVNGTPDAIRFLARRAIENIVDDVTLVLRVANTESQTQKIPAHVCNQVLEAIVTAWSATPFQAHAPDWQIELIVSDKQRLWRYFQVRGQATYRVAAAIHERCRFQHAYVAIPDRNPGDFALVATIFAKIAPIAPRQLIDEPEARVVAGLVIAIARIAKTDNDLNW